MPTRITYKMIAKEIGKSEATIKWMKKNNPRMLELLKKGLEYECTKSAATR